MRANVAPGARLRPRAPVHGGTSENHQTRLARLQWLAQLLDSRYRLPFTRFRFGLDSVIGLVPGVGDAASALIAAWIILEARRLGAPSGLLARMAGNLLADAALGTIPLAGDVFDAAYKCNQRNLAMLMEHLAQRDDQPAGRR
jgi:hypothetical protein